MSIGVARILSAGVHFFAKKLTFFSRRRLNIPPRKTPKKLTALAGVHFVSCGGALTHFSCKLGLKKFFHRPGGVQVYPLHPSLLRICVCLKITYSAMSLTHDCSYGLICAFKRVYSALILLSVCLPVALKLKLNTLYPKTYCKYHKFSEPLYLLHLVTRPSLTLFSLPPPPGSAFFVKEYFPVSIF